MARHRNSGVCFGTPISRVKIRSVSQTKASSRFLRYLPGRLVVAWAVLGAAAGVALMYCPAVYEVKLSDPGGYITPSESPRLSRRGIYFTDVRVRVLRTVVYEENSQEHQDISHTIDQWHRRVATRLLLLGAIFGGLIGWHEQRRWRKKQSPRDRRGWLWLPVSGAVFALLVFAGLPGVGGLSLWDEVRWDMRFAQAFGSRSWTLKDVFESQRGEVARLAVCSVVIGWAAHVAAGARGVRLMVGRRPEQAADYGDDVVGLTNG
jgi:hypothetical protein